MFLPFEILIDLFRKRRTLALWVTPISALLGLFAVLLIALAPVVIAPPYVANFKNAAIILLLAFGSLALTGLASFTNIKFDETGFIENLSSQLKLLHAERDEIRRRVLDKENPNIFDTLQLSLNQLNEYYAINKGQARRSFMFSVIAVVVGLIVIVVGISIFYFGSQKNIQLTTISGIAGVVAEFIGASYFYLYRTSLYQLNIFFSELVRTQDTMLAVKLAEGLTPEAKRVGATEKVITALLERRAALAPIGQLPDGQAADKVAGRRAHGLALVGRSRQRTKSQR